MLVKWNHPGTQSFSRLLDDFFSNDLSHTKGFDSRKSVPGVNVAELEDSFRIELAAPGLDKADFTLNVDNDRLTIKAHKEVSKEEAQEKYTRREFSYNSFERSFTLPETVDQEGIHAVYENGVLNVSLPKREEEVKAAKLIEVK